MFFNESCQKNMGNNQKPRGSCCMAIEPHNFKILACLLYGYHSPQLKNIAIPAIAFSPHSFKIIITIISNITVLVQCNTVLFALDILCL